MKKLPIICAIIYGVLLLYASLMPFDFTMDFDIWYRLHHAWSYWPFNPRARISGSDVVSNLALYMPWGFLITTSFRLRNMGRLMSMSLAILACSLLSFSVEMGQFWMISRTASVSDWLLNTISGIFGASIAAARGKELWINSIRWLEKRWEHQPLDILTLSFMSLLSADALAPFLPSILLSQVWRNLKKSHFNIIEGLALHPWHWWFFTRLMVYALLTMLLAIWGNGTPRRRHWGKAAAIASIFALSLEIVKPMIASRSINMANVAVSFAGCFMAFLAGPLLGDTISTRKKLDFGIIALLIYIFYLAWTPFNFSWNPTLIQHKLPTPVQLLPFYHYAMGSTLNHARLFVQSVFLQGVLVYLVRVRLGWFEVTRLRVILAVIAVGMIGILQEGGQLLLSSRIPSMTDIYCFMIGGALGAWLPHPPSHSES